MKRRQSRRAIPNWLRGLIAAGVLLGLLLSAAALRNYTEIGTLRLELERLRAYMVSSSDGTTNSINAAVTSATTDRLQIKLAVDAQAKQIQALQGSLDKLAVRLEDVSVRVDSLVAEKKKVP